MSKLKPDRVCVHCFNAIISDSECEVCGKDIQTKDGIPSFISTNSPDDFEDKLRLLGETEIKDLDEKLSQVREHYMDGTVVDRFFKTRTACWRVLVSSHLSGRGLVIGDHEEKVGILLSEILKQTYTVDTSLARLKAQSAVAEAMGTTIQPVHSNLQSIPFPPESFDVIAVDCRAAEVDSYLSVVEELLTENGTVLLLVDGWPRESGLTGLVGLGQPPNGMSERVRSTVRGHPFGISRAVNNAGLTVADQYALLSTDRHENQRVFDVQSQSALDWLLYGSDKTASTTLFVIARHLSRLAREGGLLRQCYPRYLFTCKRSSEYNHGDDFSDSILIGGKNRSTVLRFDDGAVDRIRKIPNSRWQAELNTNAQAATDAVTGTVSRTMPNSELRQTAFGPERNERPVSGMPLDQSLERTPESVTRHIEIVFDWLVEFQRENTIQRIKKNPKEVTNDLLIRDIGLTDPPEVEHSVEIPQVITHGDLFGSNIYMTDGDISNVIDWEWGIVGANPVIDAGFFILQLAEHLYADFNGGFQTLFIEDSEYMQPLYSQIHRYCTSVNISPYLFTIYLSISYLTRIRQDMNFNKRLDINWKNRVEYIWNHTAQIAKNISKTNKF